MESVEQYGHLWRFVEGDLGEELYPDMGKLMFRGGCLMSSPCGGGNVKARFELPLLSMVLARDGGSAGPPLAVRTAEGSGPVVAMSVVVAVAAVVPPMDPKLEVLIGLVCVLSLWFGLGIWMLLEAI